MYVGNSTFRGAITEEQAYYSRFCTEDVMLEDLTNLVTWVHSHGSMCPHPPRQDGVLRLGAGLVRQCTLTWLCKAGHGYHWPFAPNVVHLGDNEVFGKRKRKKRKPQQLRGKEPEEVGCGPGSGDPSQREDAGLIAPSQVTQRRGNTSISQEQRQAERSVNEGDQQGAERNSTAPGQSDPVAALGPQPKSTSVDADGTDWIAALGRMPSPAVASKPLNPCDEESGSEPSCSTDLRSGLQPGTAPLSEHHEENNSAKETPQGSEMWLDYGTAFQRWLRVQNLPQGRPLGATPASELGLLLASFFSTVQCGRRQDLGTSGMIRQSRALDCFLQCQGCPFSLLRSPELARARRALETRFQELAQLERDREAEVICRASGGEVEELRRLGLLGRSSPKALLHLVLLNNLQAFGKGHLRGAWPLLFREFRVVMEVYCGKWGEALVECLEWHDPKDPQRQPLRLHALPDNPERCPLQDFKEYVSKRSGGFLIAQDAFYCSQKPLQGPRDNTWYTHMSLTKRQVDRMVTTLSQQILTIRRRAGEMG